MARSFRFGCSKCDVSRVEWCERDTPQKCHQCGKPMEHWFSKVNWSRDYDSMEGRCNDRFEVPAFGPGVTVGSRSEMRELQKRVPDELYERTQGDHTTMVPDPETGKLEKVTVKSQGIELGEVHESSGRQTQSDLQERAIENLKSEVKADLKAGKPRFAE